MRQAPQLRSENAAEQRLEELLRAGRAEVRDQLAALSPSSAIDLGNGVRALRARRGALRSRAWALPAAALTAAVSGVVAALLLSTHSTMQPPAPMSPPMAAIAERASEPRDASASAVAPAPALVPAPPRAATRPVRAPAREPEITEVSRFVAQLNVHHDPAGTLEAIARYRKLFLERHFEREARIAEVQANLQLGRSEAALAALDHEKAGDLHEEPTLEATHAELMWRRGRQDEALALWASLLDGALPRPLHARVLLGRGNAEWQVGRRGEALRDYAQFLNLLPNSVEAPLLRARLEGRLAD